MRKKNLVKGRIEQKLLRELPRLRAEYGVQRIAIYGSFIKGSPTSESDVDVLVQFERPLGLKFVSLAYHLEKIIGRRVDLATFETLKRSRENPRYRRIAAEIERTLHYVEA